MIMYNYQCNNVCDNYYYYIIRRNIIYTYKINESFFCTCYNSLQFSCVYKYVMRIALVETRQTKGSCQNYRKSINRSVARLTVALQAIFIVLITFSSGKCKSLLWNANSSSGPKQD